MAIISIPLSCSLKSYDRNVVVFWFANEKTKHRDKLRLTHSSRAGEPHTTCIAGCLWHFPFRLSPGQVRSTEAGLLLEDSKKIHPSGETVPSSESSNYLSPSPLPLPFPVILLMIRKHRSSLKSISPSYWHKLRLAVARAVNSVGS